ncbi:MAG TPA: 3'(2'),5'-bisphosphate nucleotidase CysQ [Spirochaetia bacterium]|nr:3'(2'),5'-bisphosphate nucleotidase CysQ [Spirochaetia bacterium]
MRGEAAGPLATLAVPLARASFEAAGAILEVYDTRFGVDFKADSSPLTEADRLSHGILLRHLGEIVCPPIFSKALPVLSEEGRDIPFVERKEWDSFWLVDPLDGTKEFVSRNGEFTINIALIHGERPVLGIVHIPVQDTLYFGLADGFSYKIQGVSRIVGSLAGPGRGESSTGPPAAEEPFYRDGLRLPLEQTRTEAGSVVRVVGSRSHPSRAFDDYVQQLGAKHSGVEIVRAGSALKFCLLAEGRADVYPRMGPTMEWDTAAGHALVNGAGKRVYRFGSEEELRYNKPELVNDWFICR